MSFQRLLQNRRLLSLAVILLVFGGTLALEAIPRLEDPSILPRDGTVLTRYADATAEQVEALVSRPLEEALLSVTEIAHVTSTSRPGISVVNVELHQDVTDTEAVWSLIRDKLKGVEPELPSAASKPTLDDEHTYALTLLVGLVWTGSEPPNRLILGRWATLLETRMRVIPGTKFSRVYGNPPAQVSVTMDPARLSALGISVNELSQKVARADARDSAGTQSQGEHQHMVRVDGAFDDLDRLRAAIVASDNEGTLRLGDVATITRETTPSPTEVALVDGRTAVLIGARMAEGEQVDEWVQRMRASFAEFSQALPNGIELELIFEQAQYTRERLRDVGESLLLGFVIVVAGLFIMMGRGAALTVGLAIPATLLLSLIFFRMVGLEIHQMSVIGLIAALGMLVDNAIVITNQLKDSLTKGLSSQEAIRRAYTTLGIPLLASTLTTVLAFLPIVLLVGSSGEFVGPLGVAVCCVLVSSYFVAMLLIPAVAPLLLQSKLGGQGVDFRWLRRPFLAVVNGALRYPLLSVTAVSALALLGGVSLLTVPLSFFPPTDRDQFYIDVRLSGSSSISQSLGVVESLDRQVRQQGGVTGTTWTVGGTGPSLYYNVVPSEDANPSFARGVVDTKSPAQTDRLVGRLQSVLSEQFPAAQVLVRKYVQGPPYLAPLEYRIHGSELAVLERLGVQMEGLMSQVPGVLHSRAVMGRDAHRVVLDLHRDQLRLANLDEQSVLSQARAAVSGYPASFLLEDTEQVRVKVHLTSPFKIDPGSLGSLPLALPAAHHGLTTAPLGAFADVSLEPTWGSIERRDGDRMQSVRGYLANDYLPAVALSGFQALLSESAIDLPPGYKVAVGGEHKERYESTAMLMQPVPVLALTMLAIITLAFNSYRRAVIVFLAALQALCLSLLALKLSGYPFGFVVIVGVMGLVGVAINATIIMISALDEAGGSGRLSERDILDVVGGATSRHIWCTTITTVAGLLPLILFSGEMWPPFAITFAGGLVFATLVAFIFTPAVYYMSFGIRATGPR